MKYGRQQDVQQLLDQYTDYVIRNEIIQEFNKAFNDMQSVVAEYKKDGNIGRIARVQPRTITAGRTAMGSCHSRS